MSPIFRALGGSRQWFFIPFVSSVHIGVLPLFLAVRGVRTGQKAVILVFAALLFIWLAFGTLLGADQLARQLPIWGSFRYSEKLVGPFTLCIAVLAGLGTDRTIDFGKQWRLAAIAAGGTLTMAVLLSLTGVQLLSAHAAVDVLQTTCERLSKGLLFATIAATALAVALRLALRRPTFRSHFPVVLAGLVFLLSVATVPFALHLGTRGLYDPAMLRLFLHNGEFVRLMHPVGVMEGDGPSGLDKTDRVEFMESKMASASYNVASRLDTYDVYTGLMPRRYTEIDASLDLVLHDWRWLAIRRFACSHVVFPNRRDMSMNDTVRVAIEGGTKLDTPSSVGIQMWTVPHRPWAFFASRVSCCIN